MTSVYDLYGAETLNLPFLRARLEVAIGCCFEERESTYQGGVYFFCGDNRSENFVLKNNVDPFDGEAVEQDFFGCPVLLYVNATVRSSELEKFILKIEDFKLLRREIF